MPTCLSAKASTSWSCPLILVSLTGWRFARNPGIKQIICDFLRRWFVCILNATNRVLLGCKKMQCSVILLGSSNLFVLLIFMSKSLKILQIFLFHLPSSHFLFSPPILNICSHILSPLQLGLNYNFHKTSSFLNGFTLRTPKSRSRLIQMLSPRFALACWLAYKNLFGQIEWKLTWWSAIRANRRKVETNKMDFFWKWH